MKNVLLAGCLLAVSLQARAADPSAPIPATVTRDLQSVNYGIPSFTVVSGYQKGPNALEVLLPDGYAPNKRYPVVYMLPVNMGTSGQWGSSIVEAKKADLHNRFQMIFVAPAYDTQPWFGDNPARPEIRQNAYMTDVVVPFIDREFSTIAEPTGRFLIGFSKSGLGAWSLFLMHLDLFGQVAIFDSFQGQPTHEQWEKWGFAETYGTRENLDRYDPMILLGRQKEFLSARPRRITILAGGPGLRTGVDVYRARLQDCKIPYVYILGSNMSHDWFSGWLPLAVASLATPDSK